MTRAELSEKAFALRQEVVGIVKTFNDRELKVMADLNAVKPSFFNVRLRSVWNTRKKEELTRLKDEYSNNPVVVELKALESQCQHMITMTPSPHGPFDKYQCQVCGYAEVHWAY